MQILKPAEQGKFDEENNNRQSRLKEQHQPSVEPLICFKVNISNT
jgi:hypothetical protein